MVINPTISKVLRRLERYFLSINNFSLDGKSYDLMLVIPSISSLEERYTWILSYSKLNSLDTQKITVEIFTDLRSSLSAKEYRTLESIQILNTETPFVKNVNFMFPFKQNTIELNDIAISGLQVNQGLILRSQLLQNLKRFKEITIYLETGIRKIMPISMDKDFNIMHFTERGLQNKQEIHQLVDNKSLLKKREKDLIAERKIAFISFDKIKNIASY